jgi:hypothetical protein
VRIPLLSLAALLFVVACSADAQPNTQQAMISPAPRGSLHGRIAAGGTIHVALLEREQLRGSKPGRGREHDHRPEGRPEPLGDRPELRPGIDGRCSRQRRAGFGTPRLAGLSSISFHATARFSTCRSASVASKRCPSGTVSRHAQTCSGESSVRRTSPSSAVAFPGSQRSFATVTRSP